MDALKTPSSDQTCSSSPMSIRAGSAERVVFPVPESPKKRVTSPLTPSLAEEWRDKFPNLTGWRKCCETHRQRDSRGEETLVLTIKLKIPFFISPAYSVPRMTISFLLKLISTEVWEVIPAVNLLAGNCPAL
jgi:hypothetical protein